MEGTQEGNATDVELDDVGINTNMEEILHDSNWVTDATYVVFSFVVRVCCLPETIP